ncbi:pyroglutamyl-peptidase I [Auritidibacter ignavus]|uniref:pyroglutamyl-peptidase I family protein n=1 Tax=Auritidibacter ignavus TaxID=678932 RepID=UPI0024B8DFB8|nr:pyroglutamyl-peptidase I [Auritidibacter ignavus]WHS35893.1 pyroglutamyl-peptidase I [Auritidibacter ignavus]
MTRVLVSGFEPFDTMTDNPSWEVAHKVSQAEITPEVHAVCLPVEFGTAARLLLDQVDSIQPDLIIAVGLAAGTETIRLERVGLNLRDARIPDNAGFQPVDQPIDPHGPAAVFSTLRLKAAHSRMRAIDLPAQLSLSAGSFVCNEVLYSLLSAVTQWPAPVPAGFVHVPDLPDPTVPATIDQAVVALQILIDESLRPEPDEPLIGGALY